VERVREILQQLNLLGDRSRLAGMARYGIPTDKALGIAVPELRALAKTIGTDHELAIALWASEVHEARLLAGMIDDPERVTEAQLEAWVHDLDSWDVCDQGLRRPLRQHAVRLTEGGRVERT
jgi:3-methyladenine DNA glycosylase AlkD